MVLDVSHNTCCAIRKKKRTDFSGILFVMVLFLICPTNIEASEADYRIHSNNEVPTFAKEIENATVPVGREAILSCVIHNLGNYKVAWVRVDTQTILTIDDAVITRSQRVSVRHMTDAGDIDRHRVQHHLLAHSNNKTALVDFKNNAILPVTTQQQHHHGGRTGQQHHHQSPIHKTWQLIIRDIQSSDAGLYMCQLNTEPMTSQTAYLGVTVPPDIVDSESSGDIMVTEGQNATLRCSATGHPLPIITWRREDGRPIQNHALTVEGSMIQLTRIPRQNIGAYLCIASNGVPPSVSKRFILSVQFPPSATVTNQLVGARQADVNVTLECHCESFPRPVIYWLRHGTGEVVVNGGRYREEKKDINNYKVSIQLIFLRLEKEDFMAYQCVCRNALGNADAVVRLYQIHPAVSDEGEMNEVYQDSDQQDGRAPTKSNNEESSSNRRSSANSKLYPVKTQAAVSRATTTRQPSNPLMSTSISLLLSLLIASILIVR